MLNTILSIMMLAALALCGGAIVLWRRGIRKQAGLMLLMAVVIGFNIAIWVVPDASGDAPADALARQNTADD